MSAASRPQQAQHQNAASLIFTELARELEGGDGYPPKKMAENNWNRAWTKKSFYETVIYMPNLIQ